MTENIMIQVDRIRKDNIELRGRWTNGRMYYFLTADIAEKIINGYESDIKQYKDRIIALNTEIAQLRAQLRPKAEPKPIPTGNIYGGGYGD